MRTLPTFRRVIASKATAVKPKTSRKVAVYVDLDVDEVSGVDIGAQGGKRGVVMKRQRLAGVEIDPERQEREIDTSKAVCMTTADKSDHSHLIQGHDDQSHGTTSSADGGEHGWHSHPWMKKADGSVVVGKARGHTHDVDMDDATGGHDDPDADDTKTSKRFASLEAYVEVCKRKYSTDQLDKMVDAGEALTGGRYPIKDGTDLDDAIHAWGRTKKSGRAAVASWIRKRATALDMLDKLPTDGPLADALGTSGTKTKKSGSPTDEDKTMTTEEKAAFDKAIAQSKQWERLALEAGAEEREFAKRLTPEARVAFVAMDDAGRKAALDADIVVYESPVSKRVFRRSHNPEHVAMVREADEAKVEVAKANAEARKAKFAKRASEELPYLPGTVDERAAIFEYAETLPKEASEKFVATMKSASNSNKLAFEEKGSRDGNADATTAGGRYTQALKRYREDHKDKAGNVPTELDATEGFLETAEGLAAKREMDAERLNARAR